MKPNITQKTAMLLAAVLCYFSTIAQPYNLSEQAPIDPAIRYGKLENGLTYYIKKNTLHEKRANFYIYNRAGSILEEDHQRGLAHFLEHMGFNGIGNFPGSNDMISYLQTIGVKFGRNLNAMTSSDFTLYMIQDVPMIREGITDSCLLIIHDWASDILCTNEELDEERGVIREEWRTGKSANQRSRDQRMKILYKGSKYADDSTIGSIDVIDNFTQKDILDFYHKWYRPDLQGVAVVGDFDVDEMEAKLKKMMGSIPKHPNPTPIPSYPIPNNKEPLIGSYTDPELANIQLVVYFKHNATPYQERDLGYNRMEIIHSLFNSMMQARTSELMQQQNLPIIRANIAYGNYQHFQADKDALSFNVFIKPGRAKEAFELVAAEAKRATEFGFADSELQRAKASYESLAEGRYAERNKKSNGDIGKSIRGHFYFNEPLVDANFALNFTKWALEDITVADVNRFASTLLTKENIVAVISGPDSEKENLPSEQELLAIVQSIPGIKVEPYVDNASDKPLVAVEPKAGKIVAEESNSALGITKWTLSNGMKVVLKHTDFKQDEVLMQAFSKGGTSLLTEEDLPSARFLGSVNAMGLADFTPIELQKKLASKRAGVQVGIGRYAATVKGECAPKDLETLMQLTYLKFTNPRFEEAVLKNQLDRMAVALVNAEKDPRRAFNDSIALMLAGFSSRALAVINVDVLSKVRFDRIKVLYESIFIHPAEFTFVFTGNVNPEVLKPLVEKYFAAIPVSSKQKVWKDEGIRPVKGIVKSDFSRKMEVEKVSVHICYTGPLAYSLKNKLSMSILTDLLRLRFTKVVREEMGATYGVKCMAEQAGEPTENYMLIAEFDTNLRQADDAIQAIHAQLAGIAKNGVDEEGWSKTVEFMQKNYSQLLKENKYWMPTIYDYCWSGIDFNTDYLKQLQELKPKDVQKLAKHIVDQKSYFEVILRPEE